MPKRMMFGKLKTARPQGGTKQQWKDCVQQDLRFMGLEDVWSEVTQQRDEWPAKTKEAVIKWEREKNVKEEADYEQKKAGVGVKCPRCDFIAKNEKGLKSHIGQKHPKWQFYEGDSSSEENSDEDSLTSGSRTRTSATLSSSSSSSTSSSTSSKYICTECGKDCTSGSGLSSHLRHSGHSQGANLSKKGR
jgi:uncharacterized C2H2 Zn-finger protein